MADFEKSSVQYRAAVGYTVRSTSSNRIQIPFYPQIRTKSNAFTEALDLRAVRENHARCSVSHYALRILTPSQSSKIRLLTT
jgi:hypothetical protein